MELCGDEMKKPNDFSISNLIIRFAKPEDKEFVLAFTEKTWEWGDYIKHVWDEWLHDESGKLFVAEYEGKPIGIMHAAFLPDKSVWLEGLRIHPDYRRKGVAYNLNKFVIDYLKEAGYKTFRVAIMSWNIPSIKLARKLSFYEVSRWVSLETSLSKLVNNETPQLCRKEVHLDMDTLWDMVYNSSIYDASRGLLLYDWKWLNFTKNALKELSNKYSTQILIRNDDLLAIFRPTPGKYQLISFVNAKTMRDLRSIATFFSKFEKRPLSTTIEFAFPKNYPHLEKLVDKELFEVEEIVIMEFKYL